MKLLRLTLFLCVALSLHAQDVLTVSITPVNPSGPPTLKVPFVATAKSSMGSALKSWSWNFGDGLICYSPNFCGLSDTHYYPKFGTYTVTFSVTDALGTTATATTTVTVATDTVKATLALLSGDNQVIGMPVTYSYTASSSTGVLSTISIDCGDGSGSTQMLFTGSGTGLTINGVNSTSSGMLCYPTKAGTLTPTLTVTDTFGMSAKATATNTTLPTPSCGNPIQFTYALPSWITSLNWLNPADTVYGGTTWTHTATATNQTYLLYAYTLQGYGQPYCTWLNAGGGVPPYTFSGTNLPPGLSVTTVTSTIGLLSGVPTTPGVYPNITLTVTDSAGTAVTLAARSMTVCDINTFCTSGPQ